MLCCGHCFKDSGLRKEIIPRLSKKQGKCPTCQATNQYLVEAKKLGDDFEALCEIYSPDDHGRVLVDWLIDDWLLFAIDRTTANSLLVEILDDEERVKQHVSPSELCNSVGLDRWEKLREELRHKNRFFPQTDFDHDRLEELFSSLMLDQDDWTKEWYRARIEDHGRLYEAADMGAPPKVDVTHGRANPAGIPYLYLGSTSSTAVTEVRPHPGDKVCVADFSVEDGLKLVDLRNPRELVSPFLLEDEEAIGLMRGDIEFLERLGQELTTPVPPNAAAVDYIPSQYLCEFIKKCGYQGVIYSSSVSDGVNLALFDPSKADVGDVQEYTIDSINVDMSPVA